MTAWGRRTVAALPGPANKARMPGGGYSQSVNKFQPVANQQQKFPAPSESCSTLNILSPINNRIIGKNTIQHPTA